jgi:ornithine carbamoyltransferase
MPDAKAAAGEVRHFLDLDVLPVEVLRKIIEAGKALKRGEFPNGNKKPLADKALAMIFE